MLDGVQDWGHVGLGQARGFPWTWWHPHQWLMTVGAMAGAVLHLGLLWLWANPGHKRLLASLWGFLLESLSPWLHPGVRNLPDVTARSLILPASSD